MAVPAGHYDLGPGRRNLLIGFGITIVSDIGLVSALLSCTWRRNRYVHYLYGHGWLQLHCSPSCKAARLIFVIAFFPAVMTYMSAHFVQGGPLQLHSWKEELFGGTAGKKLKKDRFPKMILVTPQLRAAISGIIGYKIGMPAGS